MQITLPANHHSRRRPAFRKFDAIPAEHRGYITSHGRSSIRAEDVTFVNLATYRDILSWAGYELSASDQHEAETV